MRAGFWADHVPNRRDPHVPTSFVSAILSAPFIPKADTRMAETHLEMVAGLVQANWLRHHRRGSRSGGEPLLCVGVIDFEEDAQELARAVTYAMSWCTGTSECRGFNGPTRTTRGESDARRRGIGNS